MSDNSTSERPDQNGSGEKFNENVSENPIENRSEKPKKGYYGDDDYTPEFIKAKCENPPLLPGESKDEFLEIFDTYELFHNGRAKTVAEIITALGVAATWPSAAQGQQTAYRPT